ncbi:MAG: large-conductance mechanosensitive channel protein MscL [Clostridiaceae bacterium]|nr:large-conductance mechanosensitive channel protein MscL [Clostridiaceae bacterium]
MLKEFKEFISRGNVLDLAIGVVIGGAFSAIIDSLVADIIMPLIGLLLGDMSLGDMKAIIKPAVIEAGQVIEPELAIGYGNFIQMIVNFLLISFFIFLMIKAFNKLRRKEEEVEEEPVKSEEVALLEDIRNLLANKES